MNTYRIEQYSTMPLLLILELLAAAVILTVGLFTVMKVSKDRKKTIIGSAAVGVAAAVAMVGIFVAVNAHANQKNDENYRAAVAESGENLSEDQIVKLKESGAIILSEEKTMVLSDEGNSNALTVYDESENEKSQTEAEKEAERKMKENDY